MRSVPTAILFDQDTGHPIGPLPQADTLVLTRSALRAWLGAELASDPPRAAQHLRSAGASAICLLTGAAPPWHLWLDTPQARGWLVAPRAAAVAPQRFVQSLSEALARGFVAADAAVLAAMAINAPDNDGLSEPPAGFAADPARLPLLSWDAQDSLPERPPATPAATPRSLGLYAIVGDAAQVPILLDHGVRTLQLRIKKPAHPDPGWHDRLAAAIRTCVAACEAAGAELFVNDHWELAHALGARGVHLGQEDLLALDAPRREALRASGMALGISSHSLWELCRARTLAPRYVACGPVWPTTTKAMPWLPQGTRNLRWWCHMAGTPVVAIGGLLDARRVRVAARCGANGACVVRAIGDEPERTVPALLAAWQTARSEPHRVPIHHAPRPTLKSLV